ncbi:MAG: hypothetical protein ACR2NZ_21530 [Rubripirellula sp.]
MPLLKLWNSLRGRSKLEQPTESPKIAATTAVSPSTGEQPKSKRGSKAKSGGFGLFGGGQHASLRKLVKSIPAESVLEIGVGDGSRAVAILETLSKSGHAASYTGIDEFELTGSVSLKQVHQTLRSAGIRPQLFPGTAERGVLRVAHTIGFVDLILIEEGPQDAKNQAAFALMNRICHENTVVLMQQDEVWSRVSTPQRAEIRRAA